MNKGDVIVCINRDKNMKITIGKSYIVNDYFPGYKSVLITNDTRFGNFYPIEYFMTKKEYRNVIINELLNK